MIYQALNFLDPAVGNVLQGEGTILVAFRADGNGSQGGNTIRPNGGFVTPADQFNFGFCGRDEVIDINPILAAPAPLLLNFVDAGGFFTTAPGIYGIPESGLCTELSSGGIPVFDFPLPEGVMFPN